MTLRICAKKGYRRVGLCTYQEEIDRIGMHGMGAFCGWRDLQSTDQWVNIHYNPYSPKEANKEDLQQWEHYKNSFYAWLDQEKPDVVVANSLFFYEWMKARGIHFKNEIGFVHVGAQPKEKSIAGVDQHHAKIGAAAVELIISHLQKNVSGVPDSMQTVLVYGDWIEGSSVR